MGSSLGNKLGCGKDVFYEFLNDARTDWRKLMYHINSQLWTKIKVRSDHKANDTCLIIDDTDFPKTGKRMENIGRVHSHLAHKSILGFKGLFLGITDGVTQMLLDFAVLGEKGKKGNYGMSAMVKRFEAYETIGELFREATKDSLEITISERIWGALLDLVAAIARVFNITDEDVLVAVVNESDELAHICELYKHKLAS